MGKERRRPADRDCRAQGWHCSAGLRRASLQVEDALSPPGPVLCSLKTFALCAQATG
jgi:hypothetical protein